MFEQLEGEIVAILVVFEGVEQVEALDMFGSE